MSRPIYIVGAAQVPVGEHWTRSFVDLATDAASAALASSGLDRVDLLIVSTMLSGGGVRRHNVSATIAQQLGLEEAEAFRLESACASGGSAVHLARLLLESGAHETALVVGVEKMTDMSLQEVTAALASATDVDHEARQGATFTTLNALLTRMYMERYGYDRPAMAAFSINAHHNALGNPNAMFHRAITLEQYLDSPFISSPLSVLDAAPVCDGAAAVVLSRQPSRGRGKAPVQVVASASSTDTVALGARPDPLWFAAAQRSASAAFASAGLSPSDVDLFEVHDAFPITAILSLEASGFADRGRGAALASEDKIARHGRLPLSTLGGLKARGHPVGASGVYQAVDAFTQLSRTAGDCQVPDARVAMIQSLGGLATTAVTLLLARGG